MPIDVTTWDETPANNSTIDGVNIAEACTPANMNNMGRAIMAGVKTFKLAYDALAATIVTLSTPQTLSSKTLASPALTGTIAETIYTITDGAAFEINPANGSIQTIVLGASRTPKGTSFSNGRAITLSIDDGTAFTLTWTDATFGGTGVKWLGGVAPTLALTGLTWVTLWKQAGQVYGSYTGASA